MTNSTFINLNDTVYMRLSERGIKVFKEFWKQYPAEVEKHWSEKLNKETGEVDMLLWEFMRIFGPDILGAGGNTPTVDNVIEIKFEIKRG